VYRVLGLACALLAAAGASVRAETVMAVGGVSIEGRLTGLDGEGRLAIEPVRQGGQTMRLPLTEVVEIRYDRLAGDSLAETAAPRIILFGNGDSLQGDVLFLEGESLVLTAPRLGRLSVPVSTVRGVWHQRQGVAAAVEERAREMLKGGGGAGEGAAEDALLLASGDVARGAIARLAAGRVELEHLELKKRVLVDLHDVIALRFASVGGAPAPGPAERPVAQLELRGGSRLSGVLLEASTERLTVSWHGGQKLAVPVRDLVRVSFRGGRLIWLSDLEPAAREERPILGPEFKLLCDRTAGGRPLSIGGVEFRRGLSTRVASRYVWKLPGACEAFESHLGVDDAAGASGGGLVRFRVLVDGTERFDSGPVRGGEAPRYVRVDLAGARELTLCVEAAGDLDLAGFADWAEAHLIGNPQGSKTEVKP
jgi:hypothetical protein